MWRLPALALLAAGCASTEPAQPKDEGARLSAEQTAACVAEGGCVLASDARLRELVSKAYELGRAHATKEVQGECWANTGGRGI